ncbi:MAG: hypothetical protein AAFO76_04805 [Cyanobacteria bacterium J06607_15]
MTQSCSKLFWARGLKANTVERNEYKYRSRSPAQTRITGDLAHKLEIRKQRLSLGKEELIFGFIL